MAVAVAPQESADFVPSAEELLEVERLLSAPAALDHVTCDLGGRRVLNDVTFPVEHGKITVLIGPSGVGKTICIKHLIGLQQPTWGRALADGRDWRRMGTRDEDAFRKRLSVMLQGPSLFNCGLFGSLSAFENVAFPLRLRTKASEEEIQERTWAYLRELGMAHRAEALPNEMSGGELRRIALARAMIEGTELVVMDDVESGVDHVRLRGMCDLILRRQREQGNTYLITTNEPEVAHRLADNLVVLRAGRVVEMGEATEVLRSRDTFGRRLMAGDPACGLAMLDEVDIEPGIVRAKSRSTDYELRIALLFMFVVFVVSVLWLYYTFTAT